MRTTKAVEMGDTTLVAKELTGREIDRLFDLSQKSGSSIMDALLDVHDLNLVLLSEMLGMEQARLEQLLLDTPPSEYAPVIAAAKEVNPDFFAMARQLKRLVGQLDVLDRMLGSDSAKGSAASSNTDTPTPGIMG